MSNIYFAVEVVHSWHVASTLSINKWEGFVCTLLKCSWAFVSKPHIGFVSTHKHNFIGVVTIPENNNNRVLLVFRQSLITDWSWDFEIHTLPCLGSNNRYSFGYLIYWYPLFMRRILTGTYLLVKILTLEHGSLRTRKALSFNNVWNNV